MSRVIVTGGSGFIGSHSLAALVARGLDVHAVRRGGPRVEIGGVTWHTTDLLDEHEVARLVRAVLPTHLLHLAWVTTPGVYTNSVENFRWLQASLNLYRAFAECGGRRIVTAGSSYEYDWRYGYCSEAVTPLAPDTVYGTCKKALGELVDVFAQRQGLSNAWARVFFLYGPREYPERLVSSVILNLLRGTPAKCSHGEQIRDYLHVQDVADAFAAVLLGDITGPVNIGSGTAVTLKSIVTRIGEKLERPHLVELGAIPARVNDAPLVVADVARLHETGWRPAIGLEDGLSRTIAWWRDELGAAA